MIISQNCSYCHIPNDICIPIVPSNLLYRCVSCGSKFYVDKETCEYYLLRERHNQQKSEVVQVAVRGGRGNPKMMSWDYTSHNNAFSSTPVTVREQREQRMDEYLNMSLYDYKRESKQKEEWSNIERGKDIFKLNKKDKGILYSLLGSVGGTIIGTIIYLIW